MRAADRIGDLVGLRLGHPCHHAAGRGVVDVKHVRPGRGGEEVTVDERGQLEGKPGSGEDLGNVGACG